MNPHLKGENAQRRYNNHNFEQTEEVKISPPTQNKVRSVENNM